MHNIESHLSMFITKRILTFEKKTTTVLQHLQKVLEMLLINIDVC